MEQNKERIEKAGELIRNNEWVPVELCLPQSRTGSPVNGGIRYLVTVQSIADAAMQYVRVAYYHPAGSRRMDYYDTKYEKDEWESCDWGDSINNKENYISAWRPAPEAYRAK